MGNELNDIEKPGDLSDLIERIADETARKMIAYQSPVLTKEEAIVFTKRKSERAFGDWCRRLKVSPCAPEEYSRASLVRALEIHADKKFRTRNSKRTVARKNLIAKGKIA